MKGLRKQHSFIRGMKVDGNGEMLHIELQMLHVQIFVCENYRFLFHI